MARQIVKQPNGLLSVWSTHVDNFIVTDATEDDLIDYFLGEQKASIEAMVKDTIRYKPYEDCLKRIEQLNGQTQTTDD